MLNNYLGRTFITFGLQTRSTLQLSLQVLNLLQRCLQSFLGLEGPLLGTQDTQFGITSTYMKRNQNWMSFTQPHAQSPSLNKHNSANLWSNIKACIEINSY